MKICPNCNAQLDDGLAFCTNCGMRFAVPQQPAQPAPQAAPQYAPFQPQAAPQYAPVQPQPAPQAAPQYAPVQPQAAPQYAQQPYAQQGYAQPGYAPQPAPAPIKDPADHTDEFDAEDVSENKVVALTAYLLGMVGIVLAAIIAKDSKYVKFHIRQVLKFQVTFILLALVACILAITVIVPLAAGIFALVLGIIELITIVRVMKGKSVEPAIIKKLPFLK